MKKSDYKKMKNEELRDFFESILNCIHDRIYVSDSEGNIIMVNDAAIRDYNNQLRREDLVGANLNDLVKKGFMDESLTMKVLKTRKSQGLIYNEPEGHDLLAWANPYIKDDEVQFVVSTEWDMQSLDTLNSFLVDNSGLSRNVRSELLYYRERSTIPGDIVAKSEVMRELLDTAAVSARTDATVLIQGESGTGKEVLMKYMHYRSPRINSPLIEVNCGAIPENLFESEFFGYVKGAFTGASESGKAGYFEMANHGTLFLDEIEALPLPAQAKLLRVLQERVVTRIGGALSLPIDVKVVAATNANLEEMVGEKTFREDLYYRLNVIPLTIPPLRKRKEDIPEFVRYFNKHYNMKYKIEKLISPKDFDIFLDYSWPGNVRELQNLIERVLITTHDERIPRRVWEQLINIPNVEDDEKGKTPSIIKGSLKETVEEFEKTLLLSYMPYYENSRQFAELLGIEKTTVNRKINKYNIKKPKEKD